MDQYLIAEPSNGRIDLGAAPRMFEVGELVPQAMPELKGVMPVLYSVEHPDEQLRAIEAVALKDLREGLPPRVCALLDSDSDAAELTRHLSDTMALSRESGGYSVFRFYDPRVFSNLSWVLRPSQRATVFGPVKRWRYLSVEGWQTTTPDTVAPDQLLAPSAEQWDCLRRLHLIEQALKSIRDAGEPVDERTPRQLDALFTKGARYGLTAEDLLVFAVQGVLVTPNLDRHPLVAAALQPGQTPSYSEVTSQWTDENWARIARETQQYAQI